MEDLVEIRWHGRGGQGTKTAATFLAETAIAHGKHGQGFPEYGPERMGAPMRGYTRISDNPINIHCAIDDPDIVVVLDDTLLTSENVTEGLKKNGRLLVNTTASPAEVMEKIKLQDGKVFTVNATQISIDEIGRAMPNTPMIGALVKASPLLELEVILQDIKKKFSKKFNDKVITGNLKSIERAYQEVKEG